MVIKYTPPLTSCNPRTLSTSYSIAICITPKPINSTQWNLAHSSHLRLGFPVVHSGLLHLSAFYSLLVGTKSARPVGFHPALCFWQPHGTWESSSLGEGQESLAWPGTKSLCLWTKLNSGLPYRKGQSALIASLTPLSLNLKLFCIALNCSQILDMKIRILVWFLERFTVASGKAVCWQGQLLYKEKTLLQ